MPHYTDFVPYHLLPDVQRLVRECGLRYADNPIEECTGSYAVTVTGTNRGIDKFRDSVTELLKPPAPKPNRFVRLLRKLSW